MRYEATGSVLDGVHVASKDLRFYWRISGKNERDGCRERNGDDNPKLVRRAAVGSSKSEWPSSRKARSRGRGRDSRAKSSDIALLCAGLGGVGEIASSSASRRDCRVRLQRQASQGKVPRAAEQRIGLRQVSLFWLALL